MPHIYDVHSSVYIQGGKKKTNIQIGIANIRISHTVFFIHLLTGVKVDGWGAPSEREERQIKEEEARKKKS